MVLIINSTYLATYILCKFRVRFRASVRVKIKFWYSVNWLCKRPLFFGELVVALNFLLRQGTCSTVVVQRVVLWVGVEIAVCSKTKCYICCTSKSYALC